MQHRLNRFFLTAIVLTSLLAGPAFIPGRVDAQVSNYTALDSSGNFGSYGTTPGAVQCRYSGNLLSNILYPGAVRVKARSIYNTQQVHVSHRLYQRLANGSLQFRSEAAGTTATVNKTTFTNVGLGSLSNIVTGPDWVYGHMIRWYTPSTTNVEGWVIIYYTSYQNYQNGDPKVPLTTVCGSPFAPPNVWLEHHPNNTYAGTVNSNIEYELHRFAIGVTVNLRWDGTVIDSVVTNADAEGIGDFKVPAAPMGNHALEFKYGHWVATGTFTVKPRIKIIPSEDIARDQTVNVSLRGYKAGETVRIRWKKGTGWYQIAQVTTSSTGSANINVKVPKFVPNGSTSVRGDSVNASGGHAQTNAVTVFGGPFVASAASAPTATPPPTATPEPSSTPTTVPTTTPTVEATATAQPETQTPEPTSIPDASPIAPSEETATPNIP